MKLLSPTELRAVTERDYIASFKAAGYRLTDDEVRRIAITDLEVVDSARAAGDLASQRPALAPIAKPDNVTAAHQAMGTHEANGRTLRFRSLDDNPQKLGARWGAAVARLARIMEGAGRAASLGEAVKNATVPALAREWGDAYAHFLTRGAPPPTRGRIDRNPFRNLSNKDASRALIRIGEDICDRSTGVLGSWYVK